MDITWGAVATNEIAWGGLIAVYLFLAGVAGGAFLTSSLTYLLGKGRHQKVIKSGAYIAPAAIIIGLGMLVIDLGRPLIFWKLLVDVNIQSVMTIGVFIISIFTALALVYAVLVWLEASAQRPATRWQFGRKSVAVLGAIFAIGTATYTGFLLSAVTTNNLWHSDFPGLNGVPFLPLMFLVSAVSTGLGTTLIGAYDSSDLSLFKKINITLIATDLILLAIHFFSLRSVLLIGNMVALFWLGVVLSGLLIPLTLAIYGLKTHKNMVLPVNCLVVIGGLCLRYFFVYAGQISH